MVTLAGVWLHAVTSTDAATAPDIRTFIPWLNHLLTDDFVMTRMLSPRESRPKFGS